MLKINRKVAQVSFPEIFAEGAEPMDFGDWDDDEDQDLSLIHNWCLSRCRRQAER